MSKTQQNALQGMYRPLIPIDLAVSTNRTIIYSPNIQGGFALSPRPPRSRTTCNICIVRRVKCDENKPTCTRCARVGRTCSYDRGLRLRHRTAKTIELCENEVFLSGSPVWTNCRLDSLSVLRQSLTRPATFTRAVRANLAPPGSSGQQHATPTPEGNHKEQCDSADNSSPEFTPSDLRSYDLAKCDDESSLTSVSMKQGRNYCLISESDRCSCQFVAKIKAHIPCTD